ncbi:MAG: nitrite/sulfite reductase [Armatimonadota bacterium]
MSTEGSSMADRIAARKRERPLTQEEVLRRNSVERIKADKHPYDVLNDVPRFIEMAYEDIPEEDILRLQWYGLYHDKPKVGYFMMRVKIPNGILTPAQLRTIGNISQKYGQNSGELTTRQCVQIHFIRLSAIPSIFAELAEAGLTTAGGCGDNLRNVTGCPVAGIDPDERFDPTPTVREIAAFFYGNREYGNLPRKHKYTVSCCPSHCNAPEIHDIALVGTLQGGREGYAFWIGGGLSSVPRIGKNLGVFVPKEEGLEVARGLTDVWRADLRYRMSRAKARFKFMVDDDGPEVIRERLEAHLGRKLEDLEENPQPAQRNSHMGVRVQKPGADGRTDLRYVGFPVFPGLMTGEQMCQVADLLEGISSGAADFRITREQNFILTHVPEAEVDSVIRQVAALGFPSDVNPVRGTSIGCTGDPQCNFAVGPTKPKLVEIVTHLENRFGDQISDLRIYLDGCPHACGQHWVGDLGFQGTTRNSETGKITSYDIIVRGKLGPGAEIGRPLLRRVPSALVNGYVERLIGAWVDRREEAEGLPEFLRRLPDEEILSIAAGEPAAAQA